MQKNAACTPAGVQELLIVTSSGGVVARAPQPPATGFDASGIFFNQNMSFMTAKSIAWLIGRACPMRASGLQCFGIFLFGYAYVIFTIEIGPM